jgi:hypothetical protein
MSVSILTLQFHAGNGIIQLTKAGAELAPEATEARRAPVTPLTETGVPAVHELALADTFALLASDGTH